jgi:hypothetical protein
MAPTNNKRKKPADSDIQGVVERTSKTLLKRLDDTADIMRVKRVKVCEQVGNAVETSREDLQAFVKDGLSNLEKSIGKLSQNEAELADILKKVTSMSKLGATISKKTAEAAKWVANFDNDVAEEILRIK